MRDATPVLTTLVLSACGLLALVLAWLAASPAVRERRVLQIAAVEEARTLPPRDVVGQASWLWAHRLTRLQSLGLLVGLSALVGCGEGIARRQRDALAGMRLRTWTLGLVGGALTPGVVVALVLLPVPWSVPVVAAGGGAWSALVWFLLWYGRPYVP